MTNWLWDFGDGTTSSAQNPSHVYTRVGTYSPNLLALSTLGQGPLSITDQVGVNVSTNPTPAFHTLYSFTPAFGADPNSQLVLAGNTLYGTVWGDNHQDDGTIFSINTDGTGFTNLYWLNLATGGRPDGVILSGTTLYGSAAVGGPNGGGTVFALGTNGLGFTNLLNLTANADQYSGSYPFAPLVLSGATLYGSTWFGGYFNHGTLFGVNTNGTPTGFNQIQKVLAHP